MTYDMSMKGGPSCLNATSFFSPPPQGCQEVGYLKLGVTMIGVQYCAKGHWPFSLKLTDVLNTW